MSSRCLEFIRRWRHIALLSHSLLESARRGEWQQLLEQETCYLQSIEAVMADQAPQGLTRSTQRTVAGYIRQTLDNEQALKVLLWQRLNELGALTRQAGRQRSLNNAYGQLSGEVLVPAPHRVEPLP